MSELKPCPFCGSEMVCYDTDGLGSWVICVDCGASCGRTVNKGRGTREKVIEKWNRRAGDETD